MRYSNEVRQEVNPYEVTYVSSFFFRSIVSAYLLRLQVEFGLWLVGALAASVPLVAWRLHLMSNLPMSTSSDSVFKSMFLLMVVSIFAEQFFGRKVVNHTLTHFVVTFVAYVVVCLILLGALFLLQVYY